MTPLEWADVTLSRAKYAEIRNQLEQRGALEDHLREATETQPEALLIGLVALTQEEA
jgi:hypothetical protein